MKKFYVIMLAALGLASTSYAGKNVTLNVENRTLQTSVSVQKANKTAALKATEVAGKSLEAVNGKSVRSIRKADGNTSIEGEWIFYLGDYYFQESTGLTLEVLFEATLIEGDLFFEDPSGEEMPFVGTYDATASTITFTKEYLGQATPYYVYQEPFEYNYNTNKRDPINLVGTYDATAGTITFPYDQGIAWGAYNNQAGTNLAGYFGIYDFEGAERGVEWIEMENASYLENLIYSSFTQNENTTYSDVTVLQNPNNPGIFKVRNPLVAFYNANGWDGQSPAMTIDATDPDDVKVGFTGTGFTSGGNSVQYFGASYYYDLTQQVLGETLVKATMSVENGEATITFPSESLFIGIGDQAYYCPYSNVLKFTIPASKTLVGTYTMSIVPTDITGAKTADAVDMSVNVYATDIEAGEYYIEESRTTNYLKGYTIPFTLSEPNNATFTASYLGEDATNDEFPYLWASAFVGGGAMVEPQATFLATFDPETGFEFNVESGLAIWNCTSETEFSPADVYTAFYVGDTEVEIDYSNKAIVGDWIFTVNSQYVGEESLGVVDWAYKATLEGNLVFFQDEYDEYNIVAKFTGENELTFSRNAVNAFVGKYTMTQNPYSSTEANDLANELDKFVFESFKATFDPAKGTITFPEGVGLAYGYADEEGVFESYIDAFDLVSARKGLPVTLTVDRVQIKEATNADGSKYERVIVIVSAENLPEDAELTLYYSVDLENYESITENNEGMFTFNLTDLEAGEYVLTVYAQSGNTKSATVDTVFNVSASPAGVEAIGSEDAAARYYNLQGIEVNNPKAGEILIRVIDNKVSKVIVK